MKTIIWSGSNRNGSSTLSLVQVIMNSYPAYPIEFYSIHDLPLFHPDQQSENIPESVQSLRDTHSLAKAIIIVSPEYLYNIPASVKNALEWLSYGNSFDQKKVFPIYSQGTKR